METQFEETTDVIMDSATATATATAATATAIGRPGVLADEGLDFPDNLFDEIEYDLKYHTMEVKTKKMLTTAYRKVAIEKWRCKKEMRKINGDNFVMKNMLLQINANKKKRVGGRFVKTTPAFVSITELQKD